MQDQGVLLQMINCDLNWERFLFFYPQRMNSTPYRLFFDSQQYENFLPHKIHLQPHH